jgi:hypothetical protein
MRVNNKFSLFPDSEYIYIQTDFFINLNYQVIVLIINLFSIIALCLTVLFV